MKNKTTKTEAKKLMESLENDNMSEKMCITLKDSNESIEGIYFDGFRIKRLIERFGSKIIKLANCYECRASDDDPFGPPVTIIEKNKIIFVNFAGTFITAKLIKGLKEETEIFDYSYE